MGMGKEYLGPVRDALRAFEDAVRTDQKLSFESKTVRRQELDRARENVMEAVMEMARKLGARAPQ